jgi:hypothetical protein
LKNPLISSWACEGSNNQNGECLAWQINLSVASKFVAAQRRWQLSGEDANGAAASAFSAYSISTAFSVSALSAASEVSEIAG